MRPVIVAALVALSSLVARSTPAHAQDAPPPPPPPPVELTYVPPPPPPEEPPPLVRRDEDRDRAERKVRVGTGLVIASHVLQIVGVTLLVPAIVHDERPDSRNLLTAGIVSVVAGNAVEVWGWSWLAQGGSEQARAQALRLSLGPASARLTF